MQQQAKIYTFTIIHSSTEEFKDKTPYVAGIVEDSKGRRATLIEGYRVGMQIKVGMDVFYSHNDKANNPIYRFAEN